MSNITLHDATEQVRELFDQIDPETGELPGGLEEARQIVQRKAVAVVAYVLESERLADSAEDYIKDLQARVRTARRRVTWLREYLREHMAASGILKVTDERGLFSATLSIGRDRSVDVFDAAQLPSDYMREIPAKLEPDKALIRKAISDGFTVPGARIIAADRLTIK